MSSLDEDEVAASFFILAFNEPDGIENATHDTFAK
jgi:hypothetical protein